MLPLNTILFSIFIFSLVLNYLSNYYTLKTAIEIVNDMGIGYNLGNTFNCCNILENEEISKINEINIWGTTLPTNKIINKIKKCKFKTIRFQVLYSNSIYSSEKLDSNWISKIKETIKLILNANMYCILSIFHQDDFWEKGEKKALNQYNNFWKDIANEFIDYNEYLVFESNHKTYFETITLLDITQDFINIIRQSGGNNQKRLLIIPQIFIEGNYQFSTKLYCLRIRQIKLLFHFIIFFLPKLIIMK